MAKTSKLARNAQRKVLVERYAPKRAALKAVISSPKSTPEEVQAAVNALHKLPRNSSATRVRNRCSMSGRPRAFLRDFGLCRICFRELALSGQIPGVVKSSW